MTRKQRQPLSVPLSVEAIMERVARVWGLIDEGRVNEAHTIAENVVREVSHQLQTITPTYLKAYTHMYHAVAHAKSLSVRTEEVGQALYYYHQMEYFARQIEEKTLLNIALAYQGDMYRRKNEFTKAIATLEEARDTPPEADLCAKGNVMQFLARSYSLSHKMHHYFSCFVASREILERELPEVDLVIGAILISSYDTPALITEDLLLRMKPGAMIVDVTCGYGPGYQPTFDQPTTFSAPVYEKCGVLHCKIDALPAAVPQTTTQAVSPLVAPYLLALARSIIDPAFVDSISAAGKVVEEGWIVHSEVNRQLRLSEQSGGHNACG